MKNWFSSKTLWFNSLTAIATITGWSVGMLTGHPALVVGLVIINAVVNFGLRFVTKTPIK